MYHIYKLQAKDDTHVLLGGEINVPPNTTKPNHNIIKLYLKSVTNSQ